MAGSSDKDQADLIEEVLIEAKLTIGDLRAKAPKDATRHIKIVDDLDHRQHQTGGHLQRSIDSFDYKSLLIKPMYPELAVLVSKRAVKGALTLDGRPT